MDQPFLDISFSGIIQCVSFCVWFLSLRVMCSRFIHAVTHISTLFLFMVESSSVVWIGYTVFYWWACGLFLLFSYLEWCCDHLCTGLFVEHTFSVTLGMYLVVELLVPTYGNSVFNFLKTARLFPKWLQHFTIPPAMYKAPISPHCHQHLSFNFFSSHPSGCEVVSPCGFGMSRMINPYPIHDL